MNAATSRNLTIAFFGLLALGAVSPLLFMGSKLAPWLEVILGGLMSGVLYSLVALGFPAALAATLRDANGAVLTGRAITWSSSAPSVATVSGAGIVTGPPAATAVTTPTVLTVAIDELLVLHATTRPVSTFPLASFVVAVSCCVPPMTRDALDGATETVATGTGGGGEPALCCLKAAAMIAQPEPADAVAADDPAAPSFRSSSRLSCRVDRAVKPEPGWQ